MIRYVKTSIKTEGYDMDSLFQCNRRCSRCERTNTLQIQTCMVLFLPLFRVIYQRKPPLQCVSKSGGRFTSWSNGRFRHGLKG
ncbi:MAG TPA: hypothetical protein VLR72_06440, partial [Clostridiaceae bacterium]|nr:hypothetical protein [Clostridiaceae bacterium]